MEISCFENYVVKKVCIEERFDDHVICGIELFVEEEKLGAFLSEHTIESKEIGVSDRGSNLFYGKIKKINYEATYLGANVQVEVISRSASLDSETKCRVFQNPKKKHGSLQRFFSKSGIEIESLDGKMEEEILPEMIVQRNETDFMFLKNFYNKRGKHLIVEAGNRKICKILIGNKRENKKEYLEKEEIIKLEVSLEKNKQEIFFSTQKILELGSEIDVFGKLYIVSYKRIENIGDETIIYYRGFSIKEDEIEEKKEDYMLGLAEVVSNKSPDKLGKIQVKFLEYENELCEELNWIDYLSPLTEKENGFVMLPDIGEKVEVLMRNRECLALGCVRKMELEEKLQDFSKRYFSSRGCEITVEDKSLMMEVEKNKLYLTGELIRLSNEDITILVAEKQCEIGMKDSRFAIVDGKIQAIAKNDMEIKTKNIKMIAESEVKVKTNSFDIG